jgi:hypothetical protein
MVAAPPHQEHGLAQVVIRSADLVRRVNERRADDYGSLAEEDTPVVRFRPIGTSSNPGRPDCKPLDSASSREVPAALPLPSSAVPAGLLRVQDPALGGFGGRRWFRTSDLLRVKQALSR